MNEHSWTKATWILATLLWAPSAVLYAADEARIEDIGRETMDQWSAPYRGWHYHPDHVIPARPKIPGYEEFHSTDCPCVYQLPGQADKWYMSFIAFNGQGYDERFSSDPKVFRDGDHWTMLYFGVGRGGAHVMAAFSRDLTHWTAHPEPLYKAGGNPSGLDKQYAHKISLVYHPQNETFYLYYCACGSQGHGIGLITSKPLAAPAGSKFSFPRP